MPNAIDHALTILEEARLARCRLVECRIESANHLLDGARIAGLPQMRARRTATAARIARNLAASLAEDRTVVSLGATHHSRLTTLVKVLLTRVEAAKAE